MHVTISPACPVLHSCRRLKNVARERQLLAAKETERDKIYGMLAKVTGVLAKVTGVVLTVSINFSKRTHWTTRVGEGGDDYCADDKRLAAKFCTIRDTFHAALKAKPPSVIALRMPATRWDLEGEAWSTCWRVLHECAAATQHV